MKIFTYPGIFLLVANFLALPVFGEEKTAVVIQEPSTDFCRLGKNQSPINIENPIPVDLDSPDFQYGEIGLVIHEDKTIGVVGRSSVRIAGKNYALKRIHFHSPAETLIAGESYEVEIQLVYQNGVGRAVIVAVFLTVGAGNPEIAKIIDAIEQNTSATVDLRGLLPEKQGYYSYAGSMTVPPCLEGVHWFVMKTPLNLAPDQLLALTRTIATPGRNPQPLNGRNIWAKIW